MQLCYASLDCNHSNTEFKCVKYVKNYDGDTIVFNIPNVPSIIGDRISVRVRGIDTPEIRTKNKCEKNLGRTARKLVKSLLSKSKRIDLKNVQRGKYFRVVADVSIDGRNLKDILLKENLAYEYDGGTKKYLNWCNFRSTASSK